MALFLSGGKFINMVEPISQTVASSFVIGIIMGVIDEISIKLLGIIWLLALIWTIFSFFIQGPSGYASGLNWGVWNWITMVITVSISFAIGKSGLNSVKNAFRRKK